MDKLLPDLPTPDGFRSLWFRWFRGFTGSFFFSLDLINAPFAAFLLALLPRICNEPLSILASSSRRSIPAEL